MPNDTFTGLDLGMRRDPSALVCAERRMIEYAGSPPTPDDTQQLKVLPPNSLLRIAHGHSRGAQATAPEATRSQYVCRHIQQFPLNLAGGYPEVVERVAVFYANPKVAGSWLVVDQTGVGAAVVDMFRRARREAVRCAKCGGVGVGDRGPCITCAGRGRIKLDARVAAVHITGQSATDGRGWRYDAPTDTWYVGKRELISVVLVLMESDPGRFVVDPRLKHAATLTTELGNFRAKRKKDSKDESLECLVAGTMVDTSIGWLPIEQVTTGMRVRTRNGYNKVVWSGETKRVRELASTRIGQFSVTGTPDHLVWTRNRGWVELRHLLAGDECLSSCRSQPGRQTSSPMGDGRLTQKLSCSMVLNTDVRRVMPTTCLSEAERTYTERYGDFSTEVSPTGFTSITSTRTRTTIASEISNAYLILTIANDIIQGKLTSKRCALPAVNNSRADQDDVPVPTAYMTNEVSSVLCVVPKSDSRSVSLPVWNVDHSFQRMEPDGMVRRSCSAPPDAERRTGTGTANTQKQNACGASTNSQENKGALSIAQVVAPPSIVCTEQDTPVYDLVVECQHEFFANGVLVHNSWRESMHDDLVLAAAIMLWFAERGSKKPWVKM